MPRPLKKGDACVAPTNNRIVTGASGDHYEGSYDAALPLLVALAEHGFRDAEAIDTDRDPAIDRDLREHRADLIGGQPIAQRAANVRRKLLHLPERRDH